MTTNQALAVKLLSRGDSMEIRHGRLVIEAASGVPVPEDWMAKHSDGLALEILRAVGLEAFYYTGYATSNNRVSENGAREGGLNLNMESALTVEYASTIFNVSLERARSTSAGNKGDPLPRGHFRLKHDKGRDPKQHAFYRFWKSTDLKMPKMSSFHEYMGNLSGILFTSDRHASKKGKLVASQMRALNLSPTQVRNAILTDKAPTNYRQATDKAPTNVTDKETTQTHATKGNQPVLTAGQNNCVNKVISKEGNKRFLHSINTPTHGDHSHQVTDNARAPKAANEPRLDDADWWRSYDGDTR